MSQMSLGSIRRYAPVILMLSALVLGACSPVVAPAGGTVPQAAETATAEPAEETAAEAAGESASAAGIYKAFAPGASSPGLEMTLYLNADGSVRVINDYQNEEPPYVELGEWSAEGDQVTVTITGDIFDGEERTLDTPASRTYTLADNRLTSAEVALLWYAFTALATGTTPDYEASALEDAAAAGEYAGYYKSFSPSASCCGLDRTLLLAFDNSARLVSDYLNGEAPIVETGTWEVGADGRITVTLTGRADGTVYEAPDVIVLEVQDGLLVSVEADAALYGSEGLRFYYYPGLALPSMR